MIVRNISDIEGTEDDIVTDTWRSKRIILKKDGMGYSVHETTIFAGTETHIWYQNHLESVFCIQGEGEVETIPDGKIYPIKPGVLYALNEHDNHFLRAKTELKMICVFNPPLTGREVHDETGVYPLID
ncbi:MAG: ectoine synthase [Burkholderiales bacterium]|jgi:L-ectoine synthase|tara:strand:- start:5317 stop:5700 length:384 start_codon:yes stop_codon:yes gene_type:complete